MRQTVRVLTARVSIGLRPDRVTEHQARLLPLCVCKQSSGPLTSPTINNTFLLRLIRPLLFPTTPATHSGSGTDFSETSTEVVLALSNLLYPTGLTRHSKVKMTHGKSLHVISKGKNYPLQAWVKYHKKEACRFPWQPGHYGSIRGRKKAREC